MREQALKFRLQGWTYAAIAAHYKVSRQYIQQILRPAGAVRALLRERAKAQCERCGQPAPYGHVHHRLTKGLKLVEHNGAVNLEWLCTSCHTSAHTRSRTKRPKVERDKNPFAVALGRLASNKLSKPQRRAKAQHAARVRWDRVKAAS